MEVKTGLKERLLAFIAVQRISVREFERKCGLGNGFVSKIGLSLGVDKLEKILQSFPSINKDWLLFDNGEMLLDKDPTSDNSLSDYHSNFKRVCSLIQKKDEQIDRLISLLELEKSEVSKKEKVKNVV